MDASSNHNLIFQASNVNSMAISEVGDGVCHPRHRGWVYRQDLIMKDLLDVRRLLDVSWGSNNGLVIYEQVSLQQMK